MKQILICLLLIATAGMAAQKADKKSAKPKPPGSAALEIPAGAKQTSPGTYTHVDASGKKWIYRKTPFGIARMEDNPAPEADRKVAESEREQMEAITVQEDGDVLRFSRPGPFGEYKWTKKKSELNDMESAAWKRAKEPKNGKDSEQK